MSKTLALHLGGGGPVTGWTVTEADHSPREVTGARVVLKKDPSRPGGYFRPEDEIFPIIDIICDDKIGANAHAWLEELRAHLVATMKTPPTANEQAPTERTEDDHDH